MLRTKSFVLMIVFIGLVLVAGCLSPQEPGPSIALLPSGFVEIAANTQGCKEYRHETTGMVFVLVPGRTFNMGSTEGEGDEKPVHEVTVDSFLISKYEVTNEQFQKFVNATGYKTEAEKNGRGWIWNDPVSNWKEKNGASWKDPLGDGQGIGQKKSHPVVQVSWNDVVAYYQWAGLRLPTEAEWEYTCRAGTTTESYWGNKTAGDYMWYRDNADKKTHPIGLKKPNGFGLYDMSGNVWEWCQDKYGKDYYGKSGQDNPKGPASGQDRTLRGGGWIKGELGCRSADRGGINPTGRCSDLGFRCAQDLK